MRDPDGARTAVPDRLGVTPIVLHLRPGAREWFLAWLAEHHPDLVPRYRGLYGSGAYAPKDYQRRISACVAELAARSGVGSTTPAAARRLRHTAAGSRPAAAADARPDAEHGVQLSLL